MRWSAARRAGVALIVCGAALAAPATAERPALVKVEPLPLTLEHAAPGVRLLSAAELSSDDASFGGFSGLLLTHKRLTAISDRGAWLTAQLRRRSDGAILGLVSAEMGPLRDAQGRPLRGRGADAEGLARDGAGRFLVSFERRHRLLRYDRLGAAAQAAPWPTPEARFEDNGGLEALAARRDGLVIALAEATPAGLAATRAYGWRLAPTPGAVSFLRRDGYSPTGADFGPDDALYVLERRFDFLRGVFMRLRRFAAATVERDGDWGVGETLLELGPRTGVDNMEAIAVEAAPSERGLLVTLLSDDNFSRFQRTLLLQVVVPVSGD